MHVTTEPSATALGRLVRSAESYLTGRALALAVAADRYAHLESEITPALKAGKVVITDRYVQSSLVLQRLDGLGLAEIWSYNAHVAVPGMSVYLEDDPEVIAARLSQRPALSRLEAQGSPARKLPCTGMPSGSWHGGAGRRPGLTAGAWTRTASQRQSWPGSARRRTRKEADSAVHPDR